MSYDIRRNSEGEILAMPLELPLYAGELSGFGSQATVCLASALRHLAVCEYLDDNCDLANEPEIFESYSQEMAMASSKLVATFISLASLADAAGIDIMKEIWEVPWEV